MRIRHILANILIWGGSTGSALAGDHECVVQFYLGKMNSDGVYTPLMDCVTWLENVATVSLAPGEVVQLRRHCPGCSVCSDALVGLERHIGTGLGHATHADPVLDTLPLSQSDATELSEAGSFYLRGVAPGYGMLYYAASLQLIIQLVEDPTALGAAEMSAFNAWVVPGGLAIEDAPAGQLSVMDMSGKLVHHARVPFNAGTQTLALPMMPLGSYLLVLTCDETILRKRVVIH